MTAVSHLLAVRPFQWQFTEQFHGCLLDLQDFAQTYRIVTVAEPDWSRLTHAFGSADDLPEILDQLSPAPSSPIWGELYDRVCHQGTTYPASPFILPTLLEAVKAWVDSGRVMPLVLAADIVASPEFRIDGFEPTVLGLHRLARETAGAGDLTRTERIYVLSSAITLGGDHFWGPELARLNDEEFTGSCPSCATRLYFTIGDAGCFTSKEDPIHNPSCAVPIEPSLSSRLPDQISWAHQTALNANDEELARRIRCVFGESKCPACDVPCCVSVAIEQWHS